MGAKLGRKNWYFNEWAGKPCMQRRGTGLVWQWSQILASYQITTDKFKDLQQSLPLCRSVQIRAIGRFEFFYLNGQGSFYWHSYVLRSWLLQNWWRNQGLFCILVNLVFVKLNPIWLWKIWRRLHNKGKCTQIHIVWRLVKSKSLWHQPNWASTLRLDIEFGWSHRITEL